MITNTTCKMDMLQFEAFIQHFDYFESTWRTPGVASIIRFNFPCFPCLFWGGISSRRGTWPRHVYHIGTGEGRGDGECKML